MRRLPHCLCCLVLGLAAGSGFAADKLEIAYRPDLQTGASLREVVDTTLDQTLVIGGMNVDTDVESHAASVISVVETGPEGKTKLQGKFEYFIVSINTPIGKLEFDSGNELGSENAPAPLAPLYDLFRALSRSEWVSTLNSKPEIEALEFAGNPFQGFDASAGVQITPQQFIDDYNLHLRRFPDRPVAEGDTWERTEETQIGGGQTLKFNKKFTYLGAEEKGGNTFDRISVKSTAVEYAIGAGSQLPLKLDSSELAVVSSEGNLLYDRNLKLFVSETEKVQIKGSLNFTIDVNGQPQKVPGELDLTINTQQVNELKK